MRGFRGAFAYSTDDLIEIFAFPDDVQLAVMCNASELLDSKAGLGDAINALSKDREQSRAELVRIAVNFDRALDSLPILGCLKDKGYDVALNLMQASGKKDAAYSAIGREP